MAREWKDVKTGYLRALSEGDIAAYLPDALAHCNDDGCLKSGKPLEKD